MIADIFKRSAFEELVRIENSTAFPAGSTNTGCPFASFFQEYPASFNSARASSSDRAGWAIAVFNQRRFPPLINQPHYRVAIDSRRNRPPELHIAEPLSLGQHLRGHFRSQLIHI